MTGLGMLNTIWTKTRKYFLSFIIILVVGLLLSALEYGYKFIPTQSKSLIKADSLFIVAKKANTKALFKVKKNSEGQLVHKNYLAALKKKKSALVNYNVEKENEKVFNFDSIHYFAERFGRNTLNFIFGVFVLYIFFTGKKPGIPSFLFVTFYLSTKFFVYFWIFQKFQDFSTVIYYTLTLLSAIIVVYAMYLLTKHRKSKIQKLEAQKAQLEAQKLEIAKFAYLNVPDEKNDEAVELLTKNM